MGRPKKIKETLTDNNNKKDVKEKEEVKETVKITEPEKPIQEALSSDVLKKLAEKAKLLKKYNSFAEEDEGGIIADKLDENVKVYPTGVDVLDNYVLGCGGLPYGSMIEVSGLESSGKSTFCYWLGGRVQAMNPNATVDIYDVEAAFTHKWGKSTGLDLRRVVLPEFWGAENYEQLVKANLASTAPSEIFITDSLAVLQPQQVMEKAVEDLTMHDNMARATFLTKYFDSLRNGFWFPAMGADKKVPKDAKQIKLSKTPCVGLFINHVKPHTKSAGGKTWIEYETVGGMSMKFHASIRLTVKRIGFEKQGDKVTHQRIEVKAVKNKYAPPQRSCELLLSFDGTLKADSQVDYLELAVTKGLAEQKGAWIMSALLPSGRIQGKEAFNELVASREDLKAVIM